MIAYRDFLPRSTAGTIWKAAAHEAFDTAVEEANQWIAQETPRILHVETVVLPNVYSKQEHGTSDPNLGTVSGWADWNQFLRIWYDVSAAR